MKENEGQRKQSKHKSVFFWFGDDAAVDAQSHSAAGKIRIQRRPDSHILNLKIPYRLFQQTRTHPRRRLSYVTPIVETAAHPNANFISDGLIVEKHPINRSADGRRADGDGRRIGGAGGKGDVGSAAARDSGSHRSNVDGVGAGKQGREGDLRVGREVVLVNFAGRLPAIGAGMVARSAQRAGG